ncbi:hypothetical protein RWE87_27390 (plasmid) [Sinorhizobium meliloti]|uniref:hypothetical protein n=1 Tax=Rhizobium meliloti TaxID=382 RepID=UPI00299EA507|nr:hypothetical protein [Sinorhizobium meliloti]
MTPPSETVDGKTNAAGLTGSNEGMLVRSVVSWVRRRRHRASWCRLPAGERGEALRLLPDKGGQRRNGLAIDTDAITEILPERQAELFAGLHQSEHGVACDATIAAYLGEF